MSPDERHSLWSSLREEYVEYAFLGELCREFWRRGVPIDVLRAHTDQAGFDLVLETGPFQRHVSSTRTQKVNRRLEQKAGGCVVWEFFEAETLAIRYFRWFGHDDPRAGPPSLGVRTAKHTKANAEGIKAVRPGIRTLAWGDFRPVPSTADLASLLFPCSLFTSGEDAIR